MRKCNGTPHKGKLCESNQDDSPDTVIALLKECAKSKDLYKGIQVHNHIIKSVLLQDNVFVNNTLVSMYAKSGALQEAQRVFDELLMRNGVVLKSMMIYGAYIFNSRKLIKGQFWTFRSLCK